MSDIITAIGLLLFIEGLAFAIFPSRIKNMLKMIENIPENKLRSIGIFFTGGIFHCLVHKKIDEKFS